MKILILVEHDNKNILPVTYNVITAGMEIGSEIDLLIAGEGCDGVIEESSKIKNISKVLVANSLEYKNSIAENLSSLICEIASDYTHILAPASTFGKNVMPRVAALKDVSQISDVIEVLDQNTFQRPIYAGNAFATVQSQENLKIITIRSTAFDPYEQKNDASTEIVNISPKGDAGLCDFLKSELSKSERPELTSAKIVISGGRGMQDGSNFSLLEKVADKLGAAVGASRAAVDAGFVPNDYQVGQTGKVVAPDLYIAVGISGAIQHLAGMKDSKIIVAINKDEEAPIFQVADYGIVEDLFKSLPELDQKL